MARTIAEYREDAANARQVAKSIAEPALREAWLAIAAAFDGVVRNRTRVFIHGRTSIGRKVQEQRSPNSNRECIWPQAAESAMEKDEVASLAAALHERLLKGELSLVTAESCTGGLIAAAITEIPRASVTLERGYVTYSNESKQTDLGVPADVLQKHGAVSEQTARAMAEGALRHSLAHLAVAATGVAGPEETEDKPVGLVHFAAARRNGRTIHQERKFGDLGRAEIRRQSVLVAFALVNELLDAS
jgi:nicotinamide-nucleotide amidase